jgi:hypothetical protein
MDTGRALPSNSPRKALISRKAAIKVGSKGRVQSAAEGLYCLRGTKAARRFDTGFGLLRTLREAYSRNGVKVSCDERRQRPIRLLNPAESPGWRTPPEEQFR